MSVLVPADAARYEQADKVMKLYIQNYNANQIAKKLGVNRRAVEEHIDDWRRSNLGGAHIKNRVEELLATMDEHFGSLIVELRKTLDEIDDQEPTPQLMAQRTAAVKAMAEVEGKRIDMLQKAGLLDAADLGNEIAETEEKIASVMTVIKEVSMKCPTCGPIIKERLSAIAGESMHN